MRMFERLSDSGRRLWAAAKKHGDATSMFAAGVAVLVVIVVGSLLMRPTAAVAPKLTVPEPSRPVASPKASTAVVVRSPTPSISSPSATPATPTPSPMATSTETARPTETPREPTPAKPTSEPTPLATSMRSPSVALQINGIGDYQGIPIALRKGDTVDATLTLQTQDVDRSACSLTHSYEPDDPTNRASTFTLKPVAEQTVALADGTHTFSASCPGDAGTLTAMLEALAMDGKPEACRDFEFGRDEISATSYSALASGIVGTWTGCVTTPWTPMYEVTFSLRDDGSYSATTNEVLDGTRMTALYYGMDQDSPLKTYALTDFQASGLGIGEIDIVFDVESVVRDELRNIRLMGDKLEFEMFHSGRYGPLTYELTRVE
jgi:hypothetical protein